MVRPFEAGRLVNQITVIAETPERLPPVERSRDPREDFVLALWDAGRADWLVTGDKADLLALDRYRAAQVVTATTFAALL